MNLYILRHGLAADPSDAVYARDADRPLTPKGERKLWKIAQAMEALELSFDLILSSPYLRARQTAEIITESLNARKKLELTDTLTPIGSVKKLIDVINDHDPRPDEILLVGHEPYFSDLISLLTSGNVGSAIVMKKGGLCKLSAELLEPGRCAAIEWLLTPKQMALMA